MSIERWRPSQIYTKQEELLLRRLRRTRKLFAFLRDHRDEIFDDAFQAELEGMYRETGAGKEPIAPALMAMAALMQGYLGVSDAEAVELTVVDLRWQMVLDCLGNREPAFSQGAFFEFRQRLIRTDMDRRLLERTVEFARSSNAFDWRKLPKTLRVAMDSSPLEGAGRVEDTVNLLAHAARKVVGCVAELLGWSENKVMREAGIPLLLQTSAKKALDVEWSDPSAKAKALNMLVRQLDAMETWIKRRLPEELARPPLKDHLRTLEQIRSQDLEPDPSGGGGGTRIREGVAEDRRVSIEDADMRHGRKSKSKRFNGYKRHIVTDLDRNLILGCAVTPANRPEEEGAPLLMADVERQHPVRELHIDRGYIASPTVAEVLKKGGEVFCKPWVPNNGALFSKKDFTINMRDLTVTCPGGEVERIRPGSVVEFEPESCAHCALRVHCTMATGGRTLSIAEDEKLQQRLRKRIATVRGRAELRQRVSVEHNLAHISQRQGNHARYRGVRNNLYDLRRAASIQNLETIHRGLENRIAA